MQRVKGHRNQAGARNGTENNEHENINSWAHQGYNTPNASMAASAYSISNYYGTSYHFPAYCVGDGTSAWPNNEAITYVSNYNGQLTPEAAAVYGVDGVYSAPYTQAAAPPNTTSFNYFPGTVPDDYPGWTSSASATAISTKQYENYYNEGAYNGVDSLKGVDHRLQTLDIASDTNSNRMLEPKLNYNRTDSYANTSLTGCEKKTTTWASIAKQPAKPVPQTSSGGSKKKGPGMPPPPMVPGRNIDLNTWEPKNNIVPKIPVAQAPPPPSTIAPSLASKSVWNGPMITPEPPPEMSSNFESSISLLLPPPDHSAAVTPLCATPSRSHKSFSNAAAMSRPPPISNSSSSAPNQQTVLVRPAATPTLSSSSETLTSNSPPHSVVDKLKDRNNYNPTELELPPKGTRFFVIKSYSEDDVHRSIKYEIWCSTEHGNKRLDDAFADQKVANGAVYLFFSVNGSGHFCGMARMISPVDYGSNSSVWAQDKWKGQFRVRWIYVKDVPNAQLRHIRLENNDNKPVTNSRDTQEVPFDKGLSVLKIIHAYSHTTSIFDDFTHYEKRQEAGDCNKRPVPHQGLPMHQNNSHKNNLFGSRSMHKNCDGGSNNYSQMTDRDGGINNYNRRITRNANNPFSNHKNQIDDLRS